MSRRIRILSRPECHLCELAVVEVQDLVEGRPGIEVDVVDIDRDPELLASCLERIPVVEVDGVEVSDLLFDREAFLAALDPPGTAGPGTLEP